MNCGNAKALFKKLKKLAIMKTVNGLTLKTLLLDTITYLKFNQHLAPNWREAKRDFCALHNQKSNIKSKELLKLIALTYNENKMYDEFIEIINKYKANKFLN